MNEPAKRTLGRYLADASLAGLALLLVKYFGPEPEKPASRSVTNTAEHFVTMTTLVRKEIREEAERSRSFVLMWLFVCTLTILLGLVVVGYIAHRDNYNTTPAPMNIPVVMYTKGTSWEKGYLDSAGVNRSYHDGHDLGQINGWIKP